MAHALSPSTFVDMEVPNVDTPVWIPGLQTQVSNYPFTPTQSTTIPPRTHVQFDPNHSPNPTVPPLIWNTNRDDMQLCTPSSAGTAEKGSQVSSGLRYELPGMETREIGHLTTQVQDNWDKLFDILEKQETTVSALTNELKQTTT